MASQKREAAIVGIHEYPLRVAPGVSAMQIKSSSIMAALDDAGLGLQDIDAVYDTNDGAGGGGLGLSAFLGLNPTVIDTTQVGGSSYEFQTAHALRDAMFVTLIEIKEASSGLDNLDRRLQFDGLTGLNSRGGLEKVFQDFYNGDPHHQRQVSCAMVDIDNFGVLLEALKE